MRPSSAEPAPWTCAGCGTSFWADGRYLETKPEGVSQCLSLVATRSERVRVFLDGAVDGRGNLLLSGQDLGPLVEESWGDGDYEYWVTVEARHATALLEALLDAQFDKGCTLVKWLASTDLAPRVAGDVAGGPLSVDSSVDRGVRVRPWGAPPGTWEVQFPPGDAPGLLLLLLRRAFEEGVFANDSELRTWMQKKGIQSSFQSYV